MKSNVKIPTATGRVIDSDVHHDWPSPDDLLPYLSAGWREYVTGPRRSLPASTPLQGQLVPINPTLIWPNPGGVYRPDAYPENGGAPASDYELLKRNHLEPNFIERAILSYGAGSFVGALPNPYFADEIARGANDWCIDNWLTNKDDSLFGAVLLANQLPELAAREIHRIGGHPRMAEALLVSNGIGKPFGHPLFEPIHRAAADMDLPIAIHIGGEGLGGMGIAPVGSGMPSFYIEHFTLAPQGLMTHLVSFILHGVFEKFPNLRLLLIESSISWLPWLLSRLDSSYEELRREIPWLKRHPSEYVYDHVRITTQPLEDAMKHEELIDLLSLFNAEEILCFSSDYPHWDADDVSYVAPRLPSAWLPKVLRENAMKLYGWSDDPHAKGSATEASELAGRS